MDEIDIMDGSPDELGLYWVKDPSLEKISRWFPVHIVIRLEEGAVSSKLDHDDAKMVAKTFLGENIKEDDFDKFVWSEKLPKPGSD